MGSVSARSNAAIVARYANRASIRIVPAIIVAMLALLASCGGSARDASAPPNIILIVADGLATNDLSYYYTEDSGVPRIHTANIDRLAAEGVRFTASLDAPGGGALSQAALLTGRYAPRGDDPSLASLLAARGYATACIGRWQPGSEVSSSPTEYGFDVSYGAAAFDERRGEVEVMRNGNSGGTVRLEYLNRTYTDEAIAFIRRNSRRPFFLYIPESTPRPVHAVEPVFTGRSKRGRYGDGVMSFDFQVGRIIQELRRREIAGRTLVIVTSAAPASTPGSDAAPAGTERRRVPCVMWWPGTIRPRTVASVHEQADLYPTIAALGRAVVSDSLLDGADIGPLLWTRQ